MKNLLVMQSGGPTAAINATLVGVISNALKNENVDKVYGSINGIDGLINERLELLNDLSEEKLNRIKITPAAYLGSARHKLNKDCTTYLNEDEKEYSFILKNVKKYDIGYICIIGGNDSMDTVDKLTKFFDYINLDIHVIGVPKTIDNDLVLTDHTPGYGSALKYIATSIGEINLDVSVYEKGRVTIVEIMGRDAGWLTAGAKLASLNGYGCDLIYLPESVFDLDTFLKDVKAIYEKNKKVLVAVSEGIRDKDNKYICTYLADNGSDAFGHTQMGGTSLTLATLVKEKLNINTRAIELNLPQRCAGHLLSKTDIDESFNCGYHSVDEVILSTGKFIIMKREEEYKIKYESVYVSEVANKVKSIPASWIINGNDLSDEFIKYALPLIQGEVKQEFSNGLPNYLKR